MYSVLKWEVFKNEEIPVTEPKNIEYNNDQDSKEHSSRVILDAKFLNVNVERCYKLFEKGYSLSYVQKFDRTTKEGDLLNFQYIHIKVASSVKKQTDEHEFYFKRNATLHYLGDENMFGYASTNYNIVLVKFTDSKLKLCLLDSKTSEVQFELISASKRSDYTVYLYRKTVWVLLRNDSRSEIIRIGFNKNEVSKTSLSLGANFLLAKHGVLVSDEVTYATMNCNCFMFTHQQRFIEYNESKILVLQQIPDDLFLSSDGNYIINNLCVLLARKDCDYPPQLLIAAIHPVFRKIGIVDFRELSHYEEYCKFDFKITIHFDVMKVLIKTGPCDIMVIDLNAYKITQILKCGEYFFRYLNQLVPSFSLDGSEVRLIGTPFNFKHNMFLCAIFSIWHEFTLKEASKRILLQNFTESDIKHMNLPTTLKVEFQNIHFSE